MMAPSGRSGDETSPCSVLHAALTVEEYDWLLDQVEDEISCFFFPPSQLEHTFDT